ncbi:MAG TPA: ATP-binding protein [Polyangiaceae bacterium]|nr:ATP-binding protein [Polyangiaceae bacterium]
MDLRNRTLLLCGALALAIAASILLRGRRRHVHLIFAGVATDMGLWYLAQSLYGLFQASIWARVTAVLAILLPQFTLHFFEAIVPRRGPGNSMLLRFAGVLAVPMVALAVSPKHSAPIVRVAIFVYAFGLLAAGLFSLAVRGQKSCSRATKRRVSFLVVIGALAATFSLADFLWFIGAELPPVGAVLSIVFLFLLAESLRRERLLDLYEMVGRLMVSTALAFLLAGIFYVFVTYLGRFNTIYLNAILSAIVILVLFEPLRLWVEKRIHSIFFRERLDLENAIGEARRKLVHVLETDELHQVVLTALEKSRHATSAALYLLDKTGTAFDLAAGLGAEVPARIELATARPLLDQAGKGPVILEEIAREVSERRAAGEQAEASVAQAVLSSAAVLGPLREGIVVGIRAESGELAGLLVVADDRVRDAYSHEEVTLLESLSAQIGVVIQNSLVYQRMQERDRLAAIGQMAARLAHEVKNPLGAIKGAAQLLAEPSPGVADLDPSSREFLGIILEEVDRLDRVVGSVLDYARPTHGNPAPVDVNGVVRRTVQILSSDRDDEVDLELDLADELPRVRIDAEQLRQVLMNLVRNAMQAMNGRGKVVVGTRERAAARSSSASWVELRVTDSGPGISQKVLKNLFVPFYTTKNQGTGLGLAISQRLVASAGGTIEVNTHEGAGTTFTIVLPTSDAPIVPPAIDSDGGVIVERLTPFAGT